MTHGWVGGPGWRDRVCGLERLQGFPAFMASMCRDLCALYARYRALMIHRAVLAKARRQVHTVFRSAKRQGCHLKEDSHA